MIASELSSIDLKIKRLFSAAKNYIAMIKGVTVINNGINYTKLENQRYKLEKDIERKKEEDEIREKIRVLEKEEKL